MIEQDVEYSREEEARQDADIYRIKVTLTNIQDNQATNTERATERLDRRTNTQMNK